MKIDVVPLPRMLTDEHVRDRLVVVFDVLRATTTIATALAAGAEEIRVFDSLDAARSAAATCSGEKLLCGESKCLAPPGFDLGNSPGTCVPELVRGKTLFLSTTNGTRALVAARIASLLLTGALVNASAVAAAISCQHRDVTLLCAGTDGEVAPEDVLGAGAVVVELAKLWPHNFKSGVGSKEASAMFLHACPAPGAGDLLGTLGQTQGGMNVIAAGLPDDVAFAARLNAFDVVPRCDGVSMTIRAMAQS